MSDLATPVLSQDQNEVLREIVNIGMGQAGASLAEILQSFVELSIPQIVLARAADLPNALVQVLGKNAEVTAVRQEFFGHWHGEALAVYNESGCRDLADLMVMTIRKIDGALAIHGNAARFGGIGVVGA